MERAYCDALKMAYEFEKGGEQLYRDQFNKVTDKFAKEVLGFLANEELQHMQKIEAFNNALLGKVEFDFEKECSTDINERARQLIQSGIKKEEEKIGARSTDIDIYDIAMDMEKKGYNAYEQALKDSKNLNDKRIERFFSFLLSEEKEHYDLLAASKKYLEDPTYYFLDYGGWVFS